MLIVSQEKNIVFNMQMMKDLYINRSGDYFFICADFLGEENVTLGCFGTFERAKEALQKFVEEYKNRIPDQNTVFYMPQE